MSRRITWALLVLTSMLLVLAVVPLGVSLTARERVAFRDNQRAATRVIAAAAEEHLSDHKSAAAVRGSWPPPPARATAPPCTTPPATWSRALHVRRPGVKTRRSW